MKITGSYHLFARITILFWSLAFVWTRVALREFSPFNLGLLRYLIASAVLLVLARVYRFSLPDKKDLPLCILSGLTGFTLYVITFNLGTATVASATASVLVATSPIFTALMATALFREKLMRYQWVAIAVEFLGILIMTVYGAVISFNYGVIWLLAASILVSVYNILQRRLTKKYTALQATSYSIWFGTLFMLGFLPDSIRQVSTASWEAIVSFIMLGLFSTATAYVTWSMAFARAEYTASVTNYMFFTPFVSGILGFVILMEIPDLSTFIGGAFIIAGAVLFNRESIFAKHRMGKNHD